MKKTESNIQYRQNKNNIMEKEIKITPPEGYEIDKENSTFECIKFKPIVKRWRDNKYKEVEGYFITPNSVIIKHDYFFSNTPDNHNIFATEKQAKSALAMAQISQIMANDARFGGPVTDEEWKSITSSKYTIERRNNKIQTCSCCNSYSFLSFHTSEQRNLFLEENEDLIKDYLMID